MSSRPMEYSKEAKHLGFYQDRKLSFRKHIDYKIESAKRLLIGLRNELESAQLPPPSHSKMVVHKRCAT